MAVVTGSDWFFFFWFLVGRVGARQAASYDCQTVIVGKLVAHGQGWGADGGMQASENAIRSCRHTYWQAGNGKAGAGDVSP